MGSNSAAGTKKTSISLFLSKTASNHLKQPHNLVADTVGMDAGMVQCRAPFNCNNINRNYHYSRLTGYNMQTSHFLCYIDLMAIFGTSYTSATCQDFMLACKNIDHCQHLLVNIYRNIISKCSFL